ncbi:class I SAM-dependent methyltransferase [Endozoicomonas sp. 2B-B]
MTIDFYNINADRFYTSTVDVDMSHLYGRFTEYLPSNALILDAGCGSGRDSRAFLSMGYRVKAFDASLEMVKRAKEHTGLDVQCLSFEQFQTTEKYNGIWSCASLLHIPINELPAIMKRLEGMLAADGVWYLSFKYGAEQREKDGRHFTDINERILTGLLAPLRSLEVVSTWVTEDARPDRDEKWLNAITKKLPLEE